MERAVIKVITANWSDDRINVSLFSSLFRFAMLFIHTNMSSQSYKVKALYRLSNSLWHKGGQLSMLMSLLLCDWPAR